MLIRWVCGHFVCTWSKHVIYCVAECNFTKQDGTRQTAEGESTQRKKYQNKIDIVIGVIQCAHVLLLLPSSDMHVRDGRHHMKQCGLLIFFLFFWFLFQKFYLYIVRFAKR